MVEVSTIPQTRQVYYTTYANLPTSGLKTGDLGYATDRLVFYRWSGAAWQAVTIHSSAGAAADIPSAADLPDGSLYYETDTGLTKQVESASWVVISAGAGEGHLFIPCYAYQSIGAGTWAILIHVGQALNLVFYNSTSTDADNLIYNVFLVFEPY